MNIFLFFSFAFIFLLLAVLGTIETRGHFPPNATDVFMCELLWVAFIGCTCAGVFLILTT